MCYLNGRQIEYVKINVGCIGWHLINPASIYRLPDNMSSKYADGLLTQVCIHFMCIISRSADRACPWATDSIYYHYTTIDNSISKTWHFANILDMPCEYYIFPISISKILWHSSGWHVEFEYCANWFESRVPYRTYKNGCQIIHYLVLQISHIVGFYIVYMFYQASDNIYIILAANMIGWIHILACECSLLIWRLHYCSLHVILLFYCYDQLSVHKWVAGKWIDYKCSTLLLIHM